MDDSRDTQHAGNATEESKADCPPPSIEDAFREFDSAGREALSAALGTGRAFRQLIAADIALARAALVRAFVWACVGVIFGGSSWLLLMAVLVVALQHIGLSWLMSTVVACAMSIGMTLLGFVLAARYLRHSRFEATRRQLMRWGLIGDGDLDNKEPNP